MRYMRKIFYSDIDGTITEDGKNFVFVFPTVEKIKKSNDALVLVSSKSPASINEIRKNFNLDTPFICENGGGIIIPKDNKELIEFTFKIFSFFENKYSLKFIPEGLMIAIAEEKEKIFDEINNLISFFKKKYKLGEFLIFPDFVSKEKIHKLKNYFSGWKLAEIEKNVSTHRYFDIGFQFKKNLSIPKKIRDEFLDCLKKRGISVQEGGLFYHAIKGSDKGKAVKLLTAILKDFWNEELLTIGIGDGKNDLEMLLVVDYGFNVKNKKNKNVIKEKKIFCVPFKTVNGFNWVINYVYDDN